MTKKGPFTMAPSLTLAMILKNEEKNLPRLLDSVEGCFDEIVVVDTGSTDKTKEIALARGCKVFDFVWINDFAKARNFAFSKATCDYVAWIDGDDVLHNKEAFIKWKSNAMEFADCHLATYHYALDADGKPIISFVRERVFKRSINPVWQYPIHEGVILQPGWAKDYAIGWDIRHLRDAEDIKADKSRNIKILQDLKDKNQLDPRLKFYYGKELYEAGDTARAIFAFEEALASELEIHDRLLSYQYAAYSAFQMAQQTHHDFKKVRDDLFDKAIGFAGEGLKHDPNRAEFHITCGDAHLAKGEIHKAVPYYGAAKHCFSSKDSGSPYEGAIYSFIDAYGLQPRLQLAKCYFHMGRLPEAKKEAYEAWKKYKHPEAEAILKEIKKIQSLVRLDNGQSEVNEIVFTCPPVSAYPFDEEIYKTKPLGGSETALVQVAKELKKLTGIPVKVFNMRDEDLVADSGVEYISNRKVNEYFSKNRPKAHIAWRHNIEITKAPTYLWCHDLVTPSVEAKQNFTKILCLTPFHKDYVMAKQGVPEEKIAITSNGLDPEKFKFEKRKKNPNKLVWMSSPDRGLDRAMLVCDEVIKEYPEIELHVYYGLDNLYKYGMADLANKLKDMMARRDYVKYHGFTEQNKMYKEVSDAVVWVHPCNFIETYCITANEMLALNIYPVTRALGALKNTLANAQARGWATLMPHDCVSQLEIENYATEVKRAIALKKWESISFDPKDVSWEKVAHQWIAFMSLEYKPEPHLSLAGGAP